MFDESHTFVKQLNFNIDWPNSFHPENTKYHTSNMLFIPARAEVIWEWLIYPHLWNNWYKDIQQVNFHNVKPLKSAIALNDCLKWKSLNFNVKAIVRQCEKNEKLAWEESGFGFKAYHAWKIVPTDGGCFLLTEETQKGILASIVNTLFPTAVYDSHQKLLMELKNCAMKGYPRL